MPSGVEPLRVGETAPDFALEGTRGGPFRLTDLLQRGPVALYFYPGNDTPG